jgi:omega-amidase
MSDLRVTAVQVELAWENEEANLEAIDRVLQQQEQKTDLILLPETFTSGFSMSPERFAREYDENAGVVAWMKKKSKNMGAAIAGSVAVLENSQYYNRMIWVDGDKVMSYNKKHLFSFAGENKEYTAGTEVITPEVNGWRLRPLICYDLRFPVWSKNHWVDDRAEYDVLIYSANWPEPRVHVWKKLLLARAIENQCFAVGVNRIGQDENNIRYTGNSVFVDPYGIELADMGNAPGLKTMTFSKELLEDFRAKFPVLKDGE